MPRNLFRGYVRTKDKKCIDKFKDVPILTYDDVKDLSEYAGILASDIVLIDIDDTAQSELLYDIVYDYNLDCRANFTTRGMHFFWVNDGIDSCGTHLTLACGLTADVKVGSHNSYAILKYDGKQRENAWDVEDDYDYQKVPKWLRPIKGVPDFANMGEGDGRNEALYKYILTLVRNGFSKEEARETIKIINDYVLKDKLDDDELSVILRDEAFPEDTWKTGKKFNHADFGDYLIADKRIVNVNGTLYIYHEGIYIEGTVWIERAMIREYRTITPDMASRTLWYIMKEAPMITSSSEDYIAFNNGIYDIVNRRLLPFTPDIVLFNKIPWDYNPNAYFERTDRMLDQLSCGDESIRSVLEEMIGYCFYRKNDLSKSFILLGDKANGKTTFIRVLQKLLGDDNYTAMDLGEMGRQFSVASLMGKLANIGDDISDEFMDSNNVSFFKKIVSGAAIKAEVKYDPSMKTIKPYCKLIFSANEIPRMKDTTGAVLRRLVIIPFNAHFDKSDPDYDPYIYSKLITSDSLEYLIQLGIKGLERVLSSYEFTHCEAVEEELNDYNKSNNPIIEFLEENEIINKPTSDVYASYVHYCTMTGIKPMSSINFSKDVCSRLGLKTALRGIAGKRKRTFVGEDE